MARPDQEVPDSLFRLMAEQVKDYALFLLDPQGNVMTWNLGAQRIKGYAAEDIIGRHFSTFYPQEALDRGWPAYELKVATAEGRFEDEGWRLRKDGSTFWANVVITALRGDDGRLLGFGKVTRDLTDRKRGEDALRQSEERFRLLVSAVTEYAIFLLNPDGTVASWNAGAERLKGYRTDEILGRHFSQFYSEDDRRPGLPVRALEEALANGRWENQGWRVRKDGTRFWADVVITALRDAEGRHHGFTKVTRDLTDRKRNEDALRGILERERNAAAQLRELERTRSDLLTLIAHDLRAPVGVVQGFLHLLRTEWDTTTEADRLQFIDRIAARMDGLRSLVDDVFDLVTIEAGELRIDAVPVDVAPIVEQVAADLALAHGRRIEVAVQQPVTAIGDGGRIWQIAMNLVSNAVKFSPADAAVDIAVRSEGAEVVVEITDRGRGLDDDEQSQLFRPFSRLPSSHGTPGSGTGLFIARSLVEAQHGRIWVTSAPGAGSTFGFALPAQPT